MSASQISLLHTNAINANIIIVRSNKTCINTHYSDIINRQTHLNAKHTQILGHFFEVIGRQTLSRKFNYLSQICTTSR